MRSVERYNVRKVLEADYKPGDGEPFAVTWGREGHVIWCRAPVQRSTPPKKSAKDKPKKGK